jgi:hypothetical protein
MSKGEAASWITFEDAGTSKSGKTREWRVQPKEQTLPANCIGFIKWYSSCRKYVFFPFGDIVLDAGCLRTVADFCEHQTKEHGKQVQS